jgi:hypothetical protein
MQSQTSADALVEIAEECLANGRTRSEVAAFLVREYALDLGGVMKVMAHREARSARRHFRAAVAAAFVAVVATANREGQFDVPFLSFI